MFTDPNYRRMGIAKELLDRVVGEARDYGCGAVHITASDMGVKLYTAYGFVHNGNFMQYELPSTDYVGRGFDRQASLTDTGTSTAPLLH
jgi:GNAT superfamily N-acetyltransferase